MTKEAVNRLSLEQVITRFINTHGDRYNYSKCVFNGTSKKIEIICEEHGPFWQNVSHHFNGHGCPKCRSAKMSRIQSSSLQKVLQDFKKTHGETYDYSLVDYLGTKINVQIICRKHGAFWQNVMHHKKGSGCPTCKRHNTGKRFSDTQESVIAKMVGTHGDRYDYNNVVYKNSSTPVEIICKRHGSFMQKPVYHIGGSGCQKCNSSKGENLVRYYLDLFGLKYTEQKRETTCRNIKTLPFDFFISEHDIYIEFQGQLHFQKGRHTSAEKDFIALKNNDEIKRKWCKDNDLTLLEIHYEDIEYIPQLILSAIH